MKSILSLVLACAVVTPVFAKTEHKKSYAHKANSVTKASGSAKSAGSAKNVTAKKSAAKDSSAKLSGASDMIQKFYQSYMDFKKTKNNKPPQLPFSKSFRELIKKNEKLCKLKAKGEICGFGADADIYLETQDTDDKFNFKTSKFRIFEAEPGDVDVYFDVEPSLNKPVGTNDKKIHFKMIEENGKWVVDEIIYDKTSARQSIETEMLILQKN